MFSGLVHGLGITETESPWIETTSSYKLKENMTYQIDAFFTGDGYGIRWERGCIVKGYMQTAFQEVHGYR